MWAASITTLIGVWLMIAPYYLGLDKAAATSAYITGPLVVTAGIIALWEVNRGARYVNLVAGVWLIAGAFLVHVADRMGLYNSVISGVILVAFSLVRGKTKGSYGGGWSTLFESGNDYYKDKVVVITGATGGVGRVTAWAFAKQGAKVVLIARSKEQLVATTNEVEVYGGKPFPIVADVADYDKMMAVADLIEKELGPIDVWVNNAMNSVFAPVTKVTPQEFKRITDVTYLGTVYGAMAALHKMKPRNKGAIIFVGSALAYRGIPLQAAYCGAKHAIQGFYDSLRAELMHDKSDIRTSMVQLPAMNTTQFGWVLNKMPNKTQPMGTVYAPEVAARAILFAARHNRREILVGFSSYKAIWGNTIAPWYADWVLSRTAYQGQQTTEPKTPGAPDNVWEPIAEDRGAYGNFGSVAARTSITLWLSERRGWVMTVSVVILAMAIGLVRAWLS
jgi:short-subunit dehydrogenase